MPQIPEKVILQGHDSIDDAEGQMEQIPMQQLRRDFKSRQVNMLAIVGALGTGLIIGTGTGLSRGGPGSLLIAYTVTGAVIYFVMTAIFATGWNYFLKYAIVLANNLTAAGLVIQCWRPDLNVAIWVTVFAVVVISINVLHVGSFGEAEFMLSSIKIIALIVAMLTCLIVSLGRSPNHQRVGFRYWSEPGAFTEYLETGPVGKFLGFFACLVQSCFAYTGTEVVGVAFAETPNPRRNIPRAIRQTLWRISVFYILGVFLLGMAVPYNNDLLIGSTKASTGASASPYVIAMKLGNIGVLPDIMNAAILVFVVSASNTDIYVGARTLYSLAKEGHAPKIFTRTTKRGVPIYGVAATSMFSLLAYMNAAKSASTVFGYFVSLVTVFGTLNWVNILVSYLGFRRGMKKQGESREQLPYKGPLQPYGYNAFIPHFKLANFLTSYIGVAVYAINIVSWKIFARTRHVKAEEMDLITGRLEYQQIEEAERDNQTTNEKNEEKLA
ncbi:Amino acid/polyamine transporter I [Penicillium expansum]|uniref:Amino acid/polyamine transporter I n=1 Tax=Penicillium expansum TaxID=27334 RepID=A0A0A2IQ11_PENEN|nr:Amino acid/polyamine transporter I [Penicillium expansum]KGO42315.1 Amino acid/polyamine transporter I [Penicillium expansum]KGO45410.1 Amino acid/polyamine transporter I [Penicillium expansum]KGO56357.1 Amino acid/polyamine transporter I [Penicillium expansum]